MKNSKATGVTPRPFPVERREFLGKAAATVGLVALSTWALPGLASAANLQWKPTIRPRSDWAGEHGPTGPIAVEEPLFLLVHHTAQPGNDYSADQVPKLIRSMYWYHTGEEKGWPDLAYNFIVDQYGTIWEGRSGSLAGPVAGSATGGNQGFSQLCCFLGNLDQQDPTPAATSAMVDLLAWLAVQRQIDVRNGATTTFVSRGSNRWAEGTSVTTPTIAGHRDMSQTGCPGDSGYAFVTGALPALVLTRARAIDPSAYATSDSQTSDVSNPDQEADSASGDVRDTDEANTDEANTDKVGAAETSTSDTDSAATSLTDGTKNSTKDEDDQMSSSADLDSAQSATASEIDASKLDGTKSDAMPDDVTKNASGPDKLADTNQTAAPTDSDNQSGPQIFDGVPNWVPFAVGGSLLAAAQAVAIGSRKSDSDQTPDVV